MPFTQRKLPRLSNFDYSQNGCYFITICTHNKTHLFGNVVGGSVQLNQFGQIAQAELMAIPSHFSEFSIDHFVVMPNHIHILLTIDHGSELASPFPGPSINDKKPASSLPTDPLIIETERASPSSINPSLIETERASPSSINPSLIETERASPSSINHSIIETERASPFPTVSTIIGSYKSGVTNKIHQISPKMIVWQKSFYDHIIRDETDYSTIYEYIENNRLRWELDSLYKQLE